MPQTLYKEINNALAMENEALSHFKFDPEHINNYRDKLLTYLEKIISTTDQAENKDYLPLYKLGTSIAALIVKTRISEFHGKEYLLIEPSIINVETRIKCVEAYDALKDCIRNHDRMFIADLIERNPLDDGQLIRLIQDHDEETFNIKIERQANNSNINRLFGSSMRQ